MFNTFRLTWLRDRVLLDNLVFRLQSFKDDSWELGDDCLLFWKTKSLVDQYERFWRTRLDFRAKNILELGMFDGGSLPFWFHILGADKAAGVDIQDRADSAYLTRYLESRGLQTKIKTYWNTDQTDHKALAEIVQIEFNGRLDLVIDDACHMLPATKRSFEILFPMLRPGGLYIIEDWAWGHWPEFWNWPPPWARENEPTKLICEIVEACGSASTEAAGDSTTAISSVAIYQGFTVVERGDAEFSSPFGLDLLINRRPRQSRLDRVRASLRYRLGLLLPK